MGVGEKRLEPFLRSAGVRLTDCGPDRATVVQPSLPELENHVGVRHASALHAAGYAAARALSEAAAATAARPARLRLKQSAIAYKAMGLGELETIAEPDEDWAAAIADLGGGEPAVLRCNATTRNERDQVVAELQLEWIATPAVS
jgi:hypothetical protein